MQIDGHKDVGIVIFNALKRNTKTRVIICCLNICLALTQTKFSLSEQLKKIFEEFFGGISWRFASHEPYGINTSRCVKRLLFIQL